MDIEFGFGAVNPKHALPLYLSREGCGNRAVGLSAKQQGGQEGRQLRRCVRHQPVLLSVRGLLQERYLRWDYTE